MITDEEQNLREAVDRLAEEYGRDKVLAAVLKKKRRGTPAINDNQALWNMAALLESGEADTVGGAARLSTDLAKGEHVDSIIRRLTRKYKKLAPGIESYRRRFYELMKLISGKETPDPNVSINPDALEIISPGKLDKLIAHYKKMKDKKEGLFDPDRNTE